MHRKTSAPDAETVRFGEEIGITLMMPVRVTEKCLWLPEEVSPRYARQVHLSSGRDVARGHLAYYHKGRKQSGIQKYAWSLLDDALGKLDINEWVVENESALQAVTKESPRMENRPR